MATASSTRVPDQLPLSRTSVSWRVNAEPAVIAGGGRALLMQVAHPGVGAGVEQHSTYASDPWGRLFRTLDVMTKLAFGTPEQSARQQRMLDKMHRRVRGLTDDGTPYSAHDTDLQLWVWATLVDTALLMYEQVQPRLRPSEREVFYAESKLVAYGCGVPRGACPDAWDDFRAYVDGVVERDLRVTDSARAVATAALVPPLPGALADLAAVPNQLVTIGMLPVSLREQFGFAWNPDLQRRLDRWLRSARTAAAVLPGPARRLPSQITVRQKRPLRVPWLQRQGAEITGRRLAAAGFDS